MRIRMSRTARLTAAAAIPFVVAAAMPVADGMTYEFVMKSTSKATNNKESVTMRGRGTYAGDDAKIEILEASSQSGGTEAYGGKGTYFIVRNAGEEMLMVNPKEKQYMKWDLANMMAGMSKVVNAVGGLVKLEMSDVKIDVQDQGAGESVQGYPTRKYTMIQNYTVSAKVFGKTSKTRTETTTQYFFAPTLRIRNPFVSNSQTMAMMSQFDMFKNPDYQSQMTAANAKIPKNGVPLKMITTTISTDEKGKQETSTSVMEMVNFQRGNIPKSVFEIPSDYTMVEMPSFNAQTADGAQAEGAQGSSEKPKDPKDAAKKALKGIFKR